MAWGGIEPPTRGFSKHPTSRAPPQAERRGVTLFWLFSRTSAVPTEPSAEPNRPGERMAIEISQANQQHTAPELRTERPNRMAIGVGPPEQAMHLLGVIPLRPAYAACSSGFCTISDATFAASCSALVDKCAYLMVTLGSECPKICCTSYRLRPPLTKKLAKL